MYRSGRSLSGGSAWNRCHDDNQSDKQREGRPTKEEPVMSTNIINFEDRRKNKDISRRKLRAQPLETLGLLLLAVLDIAGQQL